MKTLPDIMTMQVQLKSIKKTWFLHICFWLAVAFSLYHQLSRQYPGEFLMNIATVAVNEAFGIVCVYTIVFVFVPRWFSLRGLWVFIGLSVACILACSALRAAVQDLIFYLTTRQRILSYSVLIAGTFIDYFGYALIFLALITLPRAYMSEQMNKRLEKERLENELSFLKAQINPHFLFNTINSIYVLIREDQRLAAHTLLTFSNLLRYQLYECNTPQVSLEQEVKYLESYISLMKIRSEGLVVTFRAPAEQSGISIAPFIFIIFVENAFKHLATAVDVNKVIEIDIDVKPRRLEFSVVNTIDTEITETGRQGIGLQNVQRRLSLLYPGRHTISVARREGMHSVELKIQL